MKHYLVIRDKLMAALLHKFNEIKKMKELDKDTKQRSDKIAQANQEDQPT